MPRRGNVPKREVLPDPLYNSVLVTKLTNSIMLDGKKGVDVYKRQVYVSPSHDYSGFGVYSNYSFPLRYCSHSDKEAKLSADYGTLTCGRCV